MQPPRAARYDKGSGKGKDKGKPTTKGACWVCGKAGHLAKDCRKRIGAVDEDPLSGQAAQDDTNQALNQNSVDWPNWDQWAETQTYLDMGSLDDVQQVDGASPVAVRQPAGDWDLTIDSGAAVSVVPEGWAPGHVLEPTPLSRSGGHFLAANGGKLYDRGLQRLTFRLADGSLLELPMRCTQATKPLVAVSDLARLGWAVRFEPGGAKLERTKTGVTRDLVQARGVWLLRARLEPPGTIKRNALYTSSKDLQTRTLHLGMYDLCMTNSNRKY